MLFYIGLYNKTYKDKSHQATADEVRRFVKEHLSEIKNSDICEKTVKISAQMLSSIPILYNLFMRGYKRFVGRAKL